MWRTYRLGREIKVWKLDSIRIKTNSNTKNYSSRIAIWRFGS